MTPTPSKLSDAQAKTVLLTWPASTADLWPPPGGSGRWIRAQPVDGRAKGPRLASPGARLFVTQPDGLWVFFNGVDSCDVVAVEVCGTVQNLNDKRSRYMPSSHSIVLQLSESWCSELVSVRGGAKRSRRDVSETMAAAGPQQFSVPVRFLRVLYALPNAIYKKWIPEHTPTGYEYFCPHSSLASYNVQKMQVFLRRMSISSQFYLDPANVR